MSAANKAKPVGVIDPGGVLGQIMAAKANRLAEAKQRVAESDLIGALRDKRERNSLLSAVSRPDCVNVIAEIKQRSPSRGIIRHDFDPLAIGASYARSGAAAISVLAEEDYFGGSLDHVRIVRQVVDLPLLRKDFIFDGYQVYESAAASANALLLIVAMLEDGLLAELIAMSAELGLDALVEVHDADEMERASRARARIIGVNNRDLKSLDVNLATSLSLAKMAAPDAVLVAESGITSGDDIRRLRSAGFKAFLIGEHLMRASDPGEALRQLIGTV